MTIKYLENLLEAAFILKDYAVYLWRKKYSDARTLLQTAEIAETEGKLRKAVMYYEGVLDYYKQFHLHKDASELTEKINELWQKIEPKTSS